MKMLVSDFDRTLYVHEKVSERNLKYLKKWKTEGNVFVIATGRDVESIKDKLVENDLTCDYCICNNGGAVYDKDFNLLKYNSIEHKIGLKLIQYLNDNYANSIGISELNRKTLILTDKGYDNQKKAKRALNIKELGKLGIIIQIHKKFDNLKESMDLCDDINTKFNSDITAYCNNLNVDIVAKDINKSEAIEYLKDLINLKDKIFVIGDSYNDIKMIQDFKGYTLKSAVPAVQRAAVHIVEEVADIILKHVI